MHSRLRISKICTFISVLALFLASCETDIPVKELVSARETIDEAKKYKAEKYSPKNLQKAEKLVYESHDFIKNEKADEARKKAEESRAEAEKALNESLKAYSSDLIKETEELIKQAENVFAEKLAPNELAQAKDQNSKAAELSKTSKFRESIEASAKARELAEKAISVSVGNAKSYHERHESSLKKYNSLSANPYSKAAGAELKAAETMLSENKTSLGEKKYREADQQITKIEEKLAEAEKSINKAEYKDKISELRKKISKLVSLESDTTLKGNLDKASVALNSAESLLEQGNISGTDEQIKEAQTLIDASDRYVTERNIKSRISALEQNLQKAIELDTKKDETDNINTVRADLEKASKHLQERNYDESIKAVTYGENTMKIILENLKKSSIQTAEVKKSENKEPVKEEKKVETEADSGLYTVKWRSKNTDCLWRIAQNLYKDAKLWPAIYLANRDQIKDPDLIFPGQKLKIPPKPKKRPPLDIKRDNKAVRKK